MTVHVTPLGDRAVLAYLPDESSAVRFAAAVRDSRFPWLEAVVPAYQSVGVYFNPDRANLRSVRDALHDIDPERPESIDSDARSFVIPCCYDFQLDLGRVSAYLQLAAERVIELHTAQEYLVYAIGFCPGFPYLGYLPPELSGVPRLPAPRLAVDPGSVGLTARQTGVYPLARPGGWNIIGRTPLVLVDVFSNYFALRVGDRVRFRSIDLHEYESLKGKRLTS